MSPQHRVVDSDSRTGIRRVYIRTASHFEEEPARADTQDSTREEVVSIEDSESDDRQERKLATQIATVIVAVHVLGALALKADLEALSATALGVLSIWTAYTVLGLSMMCAVAYYAYERIRQGMQNKSAKWPTQERSRDADRCLDVRSGISFSSFLPRRVANEDLGDATERIHMLSRDGSPKWRIVLAVVLAALWILRNTLIEIVRMAIDRLSKATD